ncbi:hypothetical protein CPC08DRAFT_702861 [Agrocybe pediades]|nr:hypothetical protein CPC08DRAFT_702861 [Agrocybe pediades]
MTDNATDDTVPTTSAPPVPQKIKKRRLHGSCDTCRKKKIKCDSANMPNNHCTNCISFNIPCEHTVPRQKKKRAVQATPQNSATYIQNLQERLEKLEKLLQDKQSTHENAGDTDERLDPAQLQARVASSKSPPTASSSDPGTSPSPSALPGQLASRRLSQSSAEESSNGTDPEDLAYIALAEYLGQLSIKNIDDKFFGKSSVFMYARQASAIRSEVTGAPLKPDPTMFRRPIYWDLQPWEAEFASSSKPTFIYPDADLLLSLTDSYFENMNLLFPLLHRPTFMKSVVAGQHFWDDGFGMTVLMVCAIGALYSEDPRVLLPEDSLAYGFSAGWKYFTQTQIFPHSLFRETTLYNLQYYCLVVIYLSSTSVVPTAWNLLGLGLRYAVEKSAHRRSCHTQKPSATSELMKRAFWCLMCIDRLKASFLGRPVLLHQGDFDAEYPIECDDEYWDTANPEQAFKQPEGKPCKISSFVCLIKLCEILATSMRLYSFKKPKTVEGVRLEEYERGLVVQLDSSMNKWKDALPTFLAWNPKIADPSFFHQSVLLHSTYHYVQIVIHQPFLNKRSMIAYASLAQCTNASRSCIHILESATARGIRPTHHIIVSAFAAGIVIVLNVWGHERSGLSIDVPKEMDDLRKCIHIFIECEKRRWIAGGRLRDLLTEAASLNGTSLARHAANLGMIPREQATSYDRSAYQMPSSGPRTSGQALDGFQASEATFSAHVPTHMPTDYTSIQGQPSLNSYEPFPSYSDTRADYHTQGDISQVGPELYPFSYSHNPELPNDMLSLFSNMPAAFNVDDWELYLRSQPPPS